MSNQSDYANASAFVRRIRAIDARIGRDNRIAEGFALGERLQVTELIRHANGHSHYALSALIKHCAECRS